MSQSCQRALTVPDNVVIDAEACRKDPDDMGRQGKVETVAIKLSGN
jgi:hypothetical protein